ncbi:immunoglobulin I-set domain protein, partial [Opisthorchis viverrini]
MEHDIITVECAAHGRPDSFMWDRANYNKRGFVRKQLTSMTLKPVTMLAQVLKRTLIFMYDSGPPTIQPNPVVHAKLGRTARLRCTVNSVPQPPLDQTHWYFNGRPVRQDNHHTFEREEFLGGVVLILQIAHVMRTDYGKYNCTVRNGYGSDWKLIELSQQEDIPLQFIVGSAIAVGILIVVGLIILCACRQRICGGKYTKDGLHRLSEICNDRDLRMHLHELTCGLSYGPINVRL